MSDTLYESYDDVQSYVGYRTSHWGAQTFTPSISHDITSVKLYLFQTDAISLGAVTCSIRATSSSLPTGADQASKTVTTDFGTSQGVLYEFIFDTFAAGGKYTVQASTEYAIVIRAPSAPVNKFLNAGRRSTSPAYAGGAMADSTNSGSTWSPLAQDWSFFEYGIAAGGGGGQSGQPALLVAHRVLR